MGRAVASRIPIRGGYLELPGTGHGFDMLDGSRTASTAHGRSDCSSSRSAGTTCKPDREGDLGVRGQKPQPSATCIGANVKRLSGWDAMLITDGEHPTHTLKIAVIDVPGLRW